MHTLSVTEPEELLSVRFAAVRNDFLWDSTAWFGFCDELFSLSVEEASSIFMILLKPSATFAMRSWVEVSWLVSVADMLLTLSSFKASKSGNWRIFLSSECFLLGWKLKSNNYIKHFLDERKLKKNNSNYLPSIQYLDTALTRIAKNFYVTFITKQIHIPISLRIGTACYTSVWVTWTARLWNPRTGWRIIQWTSWSWNHWQVSKCCLA